MHFFVSNTQFMLHASLILSLLVVKSVALRQTFGTVIGKKRFAFVGFHTRASRFDSRERLDGACIWTLFCAMHVLSLSAAFVEGRSASYTLMLLILPLLLPQSVVTPTRFNTRSARFFTSHFCGIFLPPLRLSAI